MSSTDKFHPLHTAIPSPRQFTYPFCYRPDALAELAAHELQGVIAATNVMATEKSGGKMFGVLVVEQKATDGTVQRGFLAAYSGLLGGRNDWAYFVPPVFDAQQPDGHFKCTERLITQINHELNSLLHDPMYQRFVFSREETVKSLQADIDAFRAETEAAKARRDARRRSGAPIGEAELAAMTRESQYMKAELRRRRKQMEERVADYDRRFMSVYTERIADLQQKRRLMSDDLQRWLFSEYRVLNARGEERNLIDIFADYTGAMPPAGAGDCCAPKLLQYAYRHGLRPVCMAEFWYGESPASEIRHHLQYYPACRSKCLPILTHMLQGLDVEPNPLEQPKHDLVPRLLYEDEYLLVVDKPEGMLSVPGRKNTMTAGKECCEDDAPVSVEEYFARRYRVDTDNATGDAQHPIFLKAVHRLDQSTSGILVLARTEEAYRELQRQFAERTTSKRYEAVLAGIPSPLRGAPATAQLTFSRDGSSGRISLPLIADVNDRPRQRVDREWGKEAVTMYNIVKVKGDRTLVELFPKTGRTHQLRVHCAHPSGLDSPILGDPLYGKVVADRMYLHAAELSFAHPVTGARMHFVSPSGFAL